MDQQNDVRTFINRRGLFAKGGGALLLALATLSGVAVLTETKVAARAAAAAAGAQYGRRDELDRAARSNGRRAGFNQGDSDGRGRRPYNPRGGRIYRDGDAGYYRELGDKKDYKRAYQDAFLRGYDEGYYGNGRGDDRNDRRDDRRRRRYPF